MLYYKVRLWKFVIHIWTLAEWSFVFSLQIYLCVEVVGLQPKHLTAENYLRLEHCLLHGSLRACMHLCWVPVASGRGKQAMYLSPTT